MRDLTVTGVQTCALPISAPVRARKAEAMLAGHALDEQAIMAAAGEAVKGLHPASDIHGSSGYRGKLLRRTGERRVGEKGRSRGAAYHLKKKTIRSSSSAN